MKGLFEFDNYFQIESVFEFQISISNATMQLWRGILLRAMDQSCCILTTVLYSPLVTLTHNPIYISDRQLDKFDQATTIHVGGVNPIKYH